MYGALSADDGSVGPRLQSSTSWQRGEHYSSLLVRPFDWWYDDNAVGQPQGDPAGCGLGPDSLLWAFGAIGSGVLGNVAYDAAKSMIRRPSRLVVARREVTASRAEAIAEYVTLNRCRELDIPLPPRKLKVVRSERDRAGAWRIHLSAGDFRVRVDIPPNAPIGGDVAVTIYAVR